MLQCCSSESRKSAYKVLESIQKFMSPIEMVKYLKLNIGEILKNIERPGKWRHSPSNKGRIHQHCGIVNLGCICYMISMLQQFFMVPQFRYQILKAVDDSPPNLVDYKDEKVDDNLLKQLQQMIGFLELSERQAYNPKNFCFAFKEFDGTPTKIGEQKDSQEFLNIFFDRIEHILKPTSQKYLLQDVFLGNQCSQMICQQCGQVKNRIESFYNLSLQVKGSTGIYDSLNKLVFGQTIEDYNCDGCNKKVNIMKRSLLADMPNTLIVHLQRIMFSFDTMQNDKINTRFEFPTILDLKEFSYKHVMTKENNQNLPQEHASLLNISDDDYIYRLVGVNVHVGTADHGHYYSLIDIKRGIQELNPFEIDQSGETQFKKWADVSSDPWKTFNDDKVGLFDFDKNIKEEAFGSGGDQADIGSKSDVMTDAELAAFLSTGSKTYGKSAYMLIYERKSKKNLREVVQLDQNEEQIEIIEFRKLQKQVPSWIQDLVNKDNKTFIVDSQMFNDHFFEYLKSIFKLIGSDMVMTSHQYDYNYGINFQQLKEESLNFGGKVLFDMLCYFDHNVIINDFCSNFETILLFTDSPMALESGDRSIVAKFVQKFFLEDGCDHFYKIMFNCIDSTSRKCAGQILTKAVNRLFKIYNEIKPELRETVDAVKEVKDTIDKITDLLIIVLQTKECQKNWNKLESYFKLLLSICTTSISQAQYMLEKQDIISEIIDFVLGNQSPRVLKNLGEKRVAMGGTVRPPFQPLFTLVSYLVRMTHTAQMDLEKREFTHIEQPFQTMYECHKTYFLSDEARQMLEETDFLDKGLQDNQYDDNKEYCLAIAHLCYKNLKFSRKYIYKALKAISFSDNDQIKRYLAIIEEIARIKDEYQTHRLEYLFGFGFIMHVKHSGKDLLQYGQEVHTESKLEDVFQIFTTVDGRVYDDSLLNMLLKYKSRMDSFTLCCLQSLCTLIVNDSKIGEFFSRLPAADYTQQRFTDWIKPYLDLKLIDIRKYSSSSGSAEKEEQIIKIISLFETYQQFLNEIDKNNIDAENFSADNSSLQSHKHIPYIVKNAISEKLVQTKTLNEALNLEIYQIECQWTPRINNLKKLESNEEKKVDQEQNIQQENQIEATQVQNFVCDNLLYRLTITNNLEIGIKLSVEFSTINNSSFEDMNIEVPVSGLTDYIKPCQTAHLMTLRKKNPLANFDINEFVIQINHEPYLENDYQMGSYASQTHKPVPLASQTDKNKATGRRNGILVDTQNKDYVVASSGLQQALEFERLQQNNYIDEEFKVVGGGNDFEGTEKECPICTFLNPIIYNVCEMCNHEFN